MSSCGRLQHKAGAPTLDPQWLMIIAAGAPPQTQCLVPRRAALPGDAQAILAVDYGACCLHARLERLVEHALGSDNWLNCALDIPDMSVLLRHGCAVEARVHH